MLITSVNAAYDMYTLILNIKVNINNNIFALKKH